MAAMLWALMTLLAGRGAQATPFVQVTSLTRITSHPAIRDHAATGPDGAGLAVWEEAGGLDWNGQPVPPVHLAILHLGGTPPAAVSYSTEAGNQMGPALASCFGRLWLAWYSAAPDRQTGDRDIAVAPVELEGPVWRSAIPVTRDRPGAGPVNDASPALACDQAGGRLLVTWSSGRYDPRLPGGYRDKDILLAALDSAGRVGPARRLTTAREALREMTPSLAVLPPASGGGYLLAFIGDPTGTGGYDLYLRRYDREWVLLTERRVTTGSRVSHPSLALLGDTPVLLWLDHGTTDVQLTRVGPDLSVPAPLSLRALLASRMPAAGLSPLAPLFGASLQPERDGLVLPFVAGVGRDVYLAHLAPADWLPR